MSMDHTQALARKASERYLMGEMSEPERFEFEEHYFDCQHCAEDVRTGAALARGIRAVGREDAAVAAACRGRAAGAGAWKMVGLAYPGSVDSYRGGCHVGLRGWLPVNSSRFPGLSGSRALSPVVLRAAARGDEQTIDLRSGQPFSVLSLDVNAADPGAALRYEIEPEGGTPRVTGSAVAPAPGSPLLVVVPHAKLDLAGRWTLVLRKPEGAEIARYPFQFKTPVIHQLVQPQREHAWNNLDATYFAATLPAWPPISAVR